MNLIVYHQLGFRSGASLMVPVYATHGLCPSYQMVFLSHDQLFCGPSAPPSSAHAQFHRTRLVSRRLCARSLAPNAISPEVSLVFVSPLQSFRGTVFYHKLTQQSLSLVITISKSVLRNVKWDNMWDLYWHYIKRRESLNSRCAVVFRGHVWTGHRATVSFLNTVSAHCRWQLRTLHNFVHFKEILTELGCL